MTFYLPFMFVYIMQQMCNMLVVEKSNKIKEAMKMMGLKASTYYLSWLITQVGMALISIIPIIALVFGVGLFGNSSAILIILCLFFYMLGLINIGFLLSSFIDKPKTAAAVSALIQLALVGIMALTRFLLFTQPGLLPLKYLTNLVITVPLGELVFAVGSAVDFQQDGVGFGEGYDKLLWIMLDVFLYGVIAWYIDNIYAGEYGTPKPWHFLFHKSYWFPKKLNSDQGKSASGDSLTD